MTTKFVSNRLAVLAAIKAGAEKALLAAANEGRSQTVRNLTQGSRSGARYKVPGTNTYYTASAPGEFPAVATSRLSTNIDTQVKGDEGYVGTDVEYGPYLEDANGTRQGGERPFLKRSLDQARPKMLAKLGMRWF